MLSITFGVMADEISILVRSRVAGVDDTSTTGFPLRSGESVGSSLSTFVVDFEALPISRIMFVKVVVTLSSVSLSNGSFSAVDIIPVTGFMLDVFFDPESRIGFAVEVVVNIVFATDLTFAVSVVSDFTTVSITVVLNFMVDFLGSRNVSSVSTAASDDDADDAPVEPRLVDVTSIDKEWISVFVVVFPIELKSIIELAGASLEDFLCALTISFISLVTIPFLVTRSES